MGSRLRHSRGQALCGNDGGGEGAREGRSYGDAGGEREESVIGSEIPRLGFAAFGMTGGGTGDGFPPRREQRKGGRPRGTPLRGKGSGEGDAGNRGGFRRKPE